MYEDRHVGVPDMFSIITSWNPSLPNLSSGTISLSSHGDEPGSILVTGFVFSNAQRPNTSGEMDKSRSVTLNEYMFICIDPFSSWDRLMRLALLRYVAIAELCPRPIMATSIVLRLVEAVHSVCSVDVSLTVVNSRSLIKKYCHTVHVQIHQPLSSPPPNDHRTVRQPLYRPPPSQLTSAEPRPRSGMPVRQPPRVTGRSQSEDTSNPVRHRSYTASNRHMRQAGSKQMVLIPVAFYSSLTPAVNSTLLWHFMGIISGCSLTGPSTASG